MGRHLKLLLVSAAVLLLPSAAFAQASLAGTVKDASGAVLPGVTVEASSPVLIEKTRSVVTDATGQYKLVDLRPGSYVVTFTLPGFATVRREGIELSGTATTTVNADMKVGAVEETITVSGEAPIVDVQSTTKEQVLSREVIDAIPTGRQYANLGVLVPGVVASQGTGGTSGQDVGGASGDNMVSLTAHGSKTVDMRIMNNGVVTATLQAGGGIGMATPNANAAQEVTIDSGSVSAELATGGPRINYIPRDGGNTFKGNVFLSGTSNTFQGDNFSDELKASGLKAVDAVKEVWDINPGFGGPLRKDSLWFWYTGRWNKADNYVGGMFNNLNANNPNAWTYVPDTSAQAINDIFQTDNQLRLTWQATPRNKFAGTWDQQTRCNCPFYVSATRSPEAANDRRSPTQRLLHAEWSSPVTSKLLLESVVLHRTERWGNLPPTLEGFSSGQAPGMIPVLEQAGTIPGLWYRGGGLGNGTYNNTWVPNYFWRAAMTYVTGTHAIKVGYNDANGDLNQTTYNYTPFAYRFNNGTPNQLTEFATPYTILNHEDHDLGLYAQDKFTIRHATITAGIRYDWFKSHFPAQTLGASLLDPTRNVSFAEQDNLNWKDVTPRLGVVYDVFGNGRTAVRASANKYLQGQGLNALGNTPNPINLLSLSTTRSWTDSNGDFVANCDPLNPAANGECGAFTNSNFGTTNVTNTFDSNLLTGWGHRNYNWEFSAGVQHAILPRLSVDVAWFRRIYGNFQVTDNLLVSPSDFTQYSIVAPTDPRLGSVSGTTITGLYDVNPNKFGQTLNFNTLSDNYGTQIDHWNGVDISLVARMQNGLLLQGGVSTGRETTDVCDIVSKLPEMLLGLPVQSSVGTFTTTNVLQPASQCRVQEPFLTQVKLVGSYTVPKIDVQVSGTFQSIPENPIAANLVVNNAFLATNSTLGRSLAGNAANVTVNLVQPGSLYMDRLNQLDMRVGKIVKFGGTRSVFSVDVYNLLNSSAVLQVNNTFGASWQTPTQVLQARFVKFGLQFQF